MPARGLDAIIPPPLLAPLLALRALLLMALLLAAAWRFSSIGGPSAASRIDVRGVAA